ncbi:MAG: hypothetical protein A3H71_00790 [Candidatus Sungbacteria bacterium RIFCSPLOWO2_02_FULL_48_13b]|uniref:Metallopeptidase family protein n=2 Tax=Candidatus Sungiibacteriota TaxID=1817917 RepID=A0A1G2LJP6_9BACT|nr:MAG: hypothetical protein A3C12_02825 [Candidatus Sungbacteria bacterium RIFCSPHIGHO2_02_FULL_49_20]OHA11031.1 MAG: hypothetical protein A3H71_00790 [Candidatus Sungbacteria bacterium RIFCSPLOWO2_02_FULL_48_13b]
MVVEEKQFERWVAEAIEILPPVGKRAMENVGFVVEREVRKRKAGEVGIRRGHTLLGLYEGVPKTKRGPHYYWVLPDKITIFQEAIEELGGGDPIKIREIVVETVWHEVGHHLGFGEKELRAMESRRAQRHF